MAEPRRTSTKAEGNGPDDKAAANADLTPTNVVPAGRSQPGEAVGGTLTTRPPRGVGEPASDARADEPSAAGLQEHVQKVIDSEEARGFRGYKDGNDVPNYNYTLKGVSDPSVSTPEEVVYTPKGK